MLYSMSELLSHANRDNYAIAAPNITMEMDARAALEVAEEMHAPIILDLAFISTSDLIFAGSYISRLCDQSSVPVALNLDHGARFEHVVSAIRGGFSSVMIDRSVLPFEENVAQVKELTKFAHAVGVSVEAELGHVGFAENMEDPLNFLTEPEQAVQFIKETGIDCLAVAIGTAHGRYNCTPKLNFQRLEEIKRATNQFPLVLHGGSGSGDDNLRMACSMGINKVNVATELFEAARDGVLRLDGSIYGLWDAAKNAYKEALRKYVPLCGSEGKAWPCAPKGLSVVKTTLRED